MVWIRWMKVVSTSRSPSGPGVVVVDRSTQSMAVLSRVTWFTPVPTARLPSVACQVGPRKWVMISLPLSSYRFARGTAPTPRGAVARVDLDAGGVTDEEDLVAVADLELVWDRGARRSGERDLHPHQGE